MIKSHEREKLINAAVFFATNTHYCGKIKLIKLLYLLDFEHFRQTGHIVTGMEYRALKMGPVAISLLEEWDALAPDFAEAIEIVAEQAKSKRAFNDSHFTRRELRLMRSFASRFENENSSLLDNLTCVERNPWAIVWDEGAGYLARIPYSLALTHDAPGATSILDLALDRRCIHAAIGLAH